MPRGTRHLRALSSSLLVFAGHAIFKLTYLSNHDYKHLYFESDAATVNEIVLKVSVQWQRIPGGRAGALGAPGAPGAAALLFEQPRRHCRFCAAFPCVFGSG